MECIKNGLKFTILENRGFFFFFSRSNAKHVTSSSFSPPFLQQGPRLKSRHEPNVITLVLFHLRSICHLGQTVRPSLGEPVLSLKALKCDSLFARVRFPARNRRRLSTVFEDRDQHHGPPSNRPTYTSPSINDKLSFSPSNTPKKKNFLSSTYCTLSKISKKDAFLPLRLFARNANATTDRYFPANRT